MNHVLSLDDLTEADIHGVLDHADALRERWRQGELPPWLKGQRVALWFEGQGFRNRLAFELGAREMGATVSFVPGELGVQEPLEDVGAYLANWFSLLVIRCAKHADLLQLAASQSGLRIINARTDRSHPCEVLGDLHFIRRRRALSGLKVVWLGELSNVGRSWLEAAQRLPIRLTVVCPEGFEPSPDAWREAVAGAHGEIALTQAWQDAVPQADVLLTDCWPRAGDVQQAERVRRAFLPQQVNAAMLSVLPAGAVFMPCPPVTRGQEVDAAAMASPRCVSPAAKDSLLHAQNALMAWVLRERA